MTAFLLSGTACGGGDSTSNGATGSTAASVGGGQGDGGGGAGTVAFQVAAGCYRAVSDGKDFLAVACPGSISRIDLSSGKPRWSATDPTWTDVRKLSLAGEVVIATVRVSVPASGLTAKAEGDRVVAVADGKKVWESTLSPTSDSHFNATADVVVADYSGERATGSARPGKVTAYEPSTGRVRFEWPVDGAKCSLEGPMILKSSVIACGQRFSLADGSALPLSATTRLLGASAPSDTAIGYESDGAYKIRLS